jgi:hypothetical protein
LPFYWTQALLLICVIRFKTLTANQCLFKAELLSWSKHWTTLMAETRHANAGLQLEKHRKIRAPSRTGQRKDIWVASRAEGREEGWHEKIVSTRSLDPPAFLRKQWWWVGSASSAVST